MVPSCLPTLTNTHGQGFLLETGTSLFRDILYCRIRSLQDHILNIKDNDAIMETNQCTDCLGLIDDSSVSFRLVNVALPNHMEEWSEWRSKAPSDYPQLAFEIIESLIPRTAHSFVDELREGMKDFVKVLEAICYWDVDHVATTAECLFHSFHPRKEILLYPCRLDEEFIENALIEKSKLALPDYWVDLYITANKEGHNALLWVERKTRQVMVYDGYENRSQVLDDGSVETFSRADTVVHWQMMAGLCFAFFSC